MIEIEHIINERLITLDLNASSKEGAIVELTTLLFREHKLKSLIGFVDAVIERENTMSTYCGSGIAIPHAKSLLVKEPGIAFGRTAGFKWEDDNEHVNFIFMLALPGMSSGNSLDAVHMGLISSIAELALEADIRNRWSLAKTKYDILETFKEGLATNVNV